MKNTKKRTTQCVLTMALMAIAVVWVPAGTASAEIKFEILPRLSAVEMHPMFTPLAE